ncbi:MAG: hypothetical protein ACKVN9_08300 [Methylophilaceae bacterium]
MITKFLAVSVCAATLVLSSPVQVFAADNVNSSKYSKKSGKTYEEMQFIKLFSHKNRQQVSEALGKPMSIAQASKPSNAELSMAKMGKSMDQNKVDNVEMWYYKNIVRYDRKHTYSKIELTFVNDSCKNIAYFNEPK